jgi:hypothetical protein
MVSMKLSIDKMKIGMRLRRDQATILTPSAPLSKSRQADRGGLIGGEFHFIGPFA